MVKRSASHAGSWYSDHGPTLASQLDGWLGQVEHVEGIPELPPPGARVIIAPFVFPPFIKGRGDIADG